jgi:RNA polymerase sigma-70 factor, ECF subfamily
MSAASTATTFEEIVLPHVAVAHRLARWRMRNDHDAEDVVQESLLRAFRYFQTFSGGNGRAWLLRIVQNTCSAWRGHGGCVSTDPFDEEQHSGGRPSSDPEMLLLQTDDAKVMARAMRRLPERFHRVLVLRELGDLSYRELADVTEMPIGTVMSRLSRARQALRGALDRELKPSRIRPRTLARCRLHKARRGMNRVVREDSADAGSLRSR